MPTTPTYKSISVSFYEESQGYVLHADLCAYPTGSEWEFKIYKTDLGGEQTKRVWTGTVQDLIQAALTANLAAGITHVARHRVQDLIQATLIAKARSFPEPNAIYWPEMEQDEEMRNVGY
jgi:hypothetical protein